MATDRPDQSSTEALRTVSSSVLEVVDQSSGQSSLADATETRSPGTILYVGAGATPTVAPPEDGSFRTVFLEADAKLAARLRKEHENKPEVLVLHGTLGNHGDSVTLRRFNLPELNSLRDPTGILRLYPGLRVVNETPVPVHGLDVIVGSLRGADNHLVIDLPGEEYALLSKLEQADLLERFNRIEVEAGEESYFDGARPGADALALLTDAHFDLAPAARQADPDRQRFIATFNASKYECARLRREVERLEKSVSDRSGRIEMLESRLGEALTELDSAKQQCASVEAELGRLEIEVAKRGEASESLNSRLEEALAEIDAARKVSDDLERQVEDRDAKLRVQQADLADLRDRYQNQREELLAARAFVSSVRETVGRFRGRLTHIASEDGEAAPESSLGSGGGPD